MKVAINSEKLVLPTEFCFLDQMGGPFVLCSKVKLATLQYYPNFFILFATPVFLLSEPPNVSPPLVWFKDERFHLLSKDIVEDLTLQWDPYNLTMNRDAKVTISLWGYRETSIRPELLYIDTLEEGEANDGMIQISPKDYDDRDNGYQMREMVMGMIMINLTNPQAEVGMDTSPAIWSRPMPLGWYFGGQWLRFDGPNWITEKCDKWINQDRLLKNFAYELPMVKKYRVLHGKTT